MTFVLRVALTLALLASATASSAKDKTHNLSMMAMTGACIDCDFSGENLAGVDFSKKNLEGVDLTDAVADAANFSSADMTDAILSGGSFKSADFSNSTINTDKVLGADFRSANFQKAAFYMRNVSDTKFDGANFTGAKVSIGSCSVDHIGLSFRRANFSLSKDGTGRALCVDRGDFSQANFKGAELYYDGLFSRAEYGLDSGIRITNSNVIEADFSLAGLENSDFSGSDLTGANFEGANLKGANFTGANLTDAKLCEAINPEGTVLYFGCD